MKSLIAWMIAIIVSYIVIRMIFRILFVGVVVAFELTKIIIFMVPVLILALPIYLIIRKKFIK